ncbi:MAG: thioredoxin family protein [Oscillospiraceae bacterium]|jgi:thioredoxin-like negative regulator of GroEL|nr:thioredoxin family protein [Oscillospiraceae bacterium]
MPGSVLLCAAPWCAVSRRMALALAGFTAQNEGARSFRRLDVDAAPELLEQYGLRVLPTLLFLDAQGRERARVEGECGEAELAAGG